jgi:hypothetical protein
LVASVNGGGIWTSTNGGLWVNNSTIEGNELIAVKNWTSVASNYDGSILVACANGGSIWKSINGIWVDTNTLMPNINRRDWLSVASNNDGSKFIASEFGGSIWTYQLNVNIICFKEGTTILTIDGYKPIQDLRKGDLIKTLQNGYLPIDMIGKREIYHQASTERIKDQLYKCSNKHYPEIFEDLIITGCHSILVDSFANEEERNKTIEVNGDTYVTDDRYRLPACADSRSTVYEIPGTYTIYHFALEHENYYFNYGVYANGLLVESCSKRMLKELSNMTIF